MALEIWYRDGIARQLASTICAMLASAAAHGGGNIEYCRGVLDMARAQAVAYGIPWSGIAAQVENELMDGKNPRLLVLR